MYLKSRRKLWHGDKVWKDVLVNVSQMHSQEVVGALLTHFTWRDPFGTTLWPLRPSRRKNE